MAYHPELQDEFQRACDEGDVRRVAALLADPRVDPNIPFNGSSLLLTAVKNGNLSIVRLLLDVPNIKYAYATTYWGIVYGREDILRHLLTREGLNPNVMSPVFNAVIANHMGILRLLLADPRVDPTSNRCHALRQAVETDNKVMIDALFADVRVRTALYNDEILYREVHAGKTTRVETMRCLTMAKKSMEAKYEDAPTEGVCPEHRRAVILANLLRDPRLCKTVPKHPMREKTRAIVGFL